MPESLNCGGESGKTVESFVKTKNKPYKVAIAKPFGLHA